MSKVSVTPSRRNEGSGCLASARRLSSAYFTGARLKRNSKNASLPVALGDTGRSSRSVVVKSATPAVGAGGGPQRPAHGAGPAPITAAAPLESVAYWFRLFSSRIRD
jgi:hypothetical protein